MTAKKLVAPVLVLIALVAAVLVWRRETVLRWWASLRSASERLVAQLKRLRSLGERLARGMARIGELLKQLRGEGEELREVVTGDGGSDAD